MNRKFLPALLVAVLSVVFFSCKKETDDKFKGDYSRAYFPMEIGRFVTYDVDSTLWDDFKQVKSIHKYQMRYIIADTFTDNQGRPSYRLDVLLRKGDTLPWNQHRVLYVTETENHLEWVENNLRFIKLVFPIANDVQWKGNSMIPVLDQQYQYFQDWTYRYENFEQPFNHNKAQFDNTVTVMQIDEELNNPETMPDAYAYKTYGKEVYAYDIGMVYREITRWEYQPAQPNKFRRGYQVVMKAIDHN